MPTGVEFTLKISNKKVKKKTATAIDELSMIIDTIAKFIDKFPLIWLIFSDETAMKIFSTKNLVLQRTLAEHRVRSRFKYTSVVSQTQKNHNTKKIRKTFFNSEKRTPKYLEKN